MAAALYSGIDAGPFRVSFYSAGNMDAITMQFPVPIGMILGAMMEASHYFLAFVAYSGLAGGLVCWWVNSVAQKREVPVDRLALGAMWAAMILLWGVGWYFIEQAGDAERKRLHDQLKAFAQTYAEELVEMGHERIQDESFADDPVYLAMIEKQKRWLELNPLVADIYTFRKHPEGNELIVDSETDYDRDGKFEGETESRTEIGEVWEEDNAILDEAYAGTAGFDDIPYKDRWGEWVSAYVPMPGATDPVEAVLGVDFAAADWKASMQGAYLRVIGILAVLVTLTFSAGAIIATLRSSLLERRRAARELQLAKERADEANQALETSNRDLEQFAYVASHDLQEPLRMVTGFLQLIQRRYGAEMGAEADDYIRHAVEGADRMRRLINGLLEISRLNRKGRRFKPVDVGAVVSAAIDNLSVAVEESDARIRREKLPEVLGDETQLIQLFQNLIGNAIKFCEEDPPVIEIEVRLVAEEDSQWWVFSVGDNGPGIAPEHHERIYEIFQRLQPSGQPGGTGIGLALCRRIVENHGGEITVESTVGEGCIFKFNLPAAPAPGEEGGKEDFSI